MLFGWIDVASLFSFLWLPLEVGYLHISFIHEGGELFEEIREIVVFFVFQEMLVRLDAIHLGNS